MRQTKSRPFSKLFWWISRIPFCAQQKSCFAVYSIYPPPSFFREGGMITCQNNCCLEGRLFWQWGLQSHSTLFSLRGLRQLARYRISYHAGRFEKERKKSCLWLYKKGNGRQWVAAQNKPGKNRTSPLNTVSPLRLKKKGKEIGCKVAACVWNALKKPRGHGLLLYLFLLRFFSYTMGQNKNMNWAKGKTVSQTFYIISHISLFFV